MAELLAVFEEYCRRHGYREGYFTLSSGGTSDHYLDVRSIVQQLHGFNMVGKLLWKICFVYKWKLNAVCGVAIGGIIPAVALLHWSGDWPVLIAHKPKDHGVNLPISGPALPSGSRILIVEDVVTTGRSVLHAAESLRSAQYVPFAVAAVVDREEGGAEAIRAAGLEFAAVTTLARIRNAKKESRCPTS